MGNEANTLRSENLIATTTFNPFSASFNAFSASINSYTASQNTLNGTFATTASFNAFSSSINSYTSSNNNSISSIYAQTASILSHTASINAFSASINNYTSSNNNAIDSLYNATSSLNSATSSLYAASASINAFSASILSYTASQNILNGTFATTGSNTFIGTQTITGSILQSGSFTTTGTITAQTLIVQIITSSEDFVTGSTHFGTIISNTHQFTGSVTVSGSLAVNGSNTILTNQTSSMSVLSASYASGSTTASYALNATSASYALTASHLTGYVSPFPFTGSAQITGSLGVTGSVSIAGSGTVLSANVDTMIFTGSFASSGSIDVNGNVTATSFTGSLLGTASYANNANSSSYALNATSASYASTSSLALQNIITASVVASTITFTKGDATTFDIIVSQSGSVQSSSYAATATSASYALNATSASYALNATSASYALNATSASYSLVATSASYANNANSSSYALTASFALNGGGGGTSALFILDEGITQGSASYLDFVGAGVTATVTNGTASINVAGGGGGGQSGGNAILNQTVASTTWSFTHNLSTLYPVFQVFDSNSDVIIPQAISAETTSSALIYFSTPRTGTAVATIGGDIVSASYSLVALSASYASNATSASYAVTASSANSFVVRNSLTASGLRYPTADGLEGQVLKTDGTNNLAFGDVNTMYEIVYTGENITKSDPLYISGSQGANPIVYKADAANAAKMPVVYIASETIGVGNTTRGIVLGLIEGINLTGYAAGTEVYVAAGGGWTSTRPTGSAIVQVLGIVTKEGAGGKGLVLNPGPVELPNLQVGYAWIGDATGVPQAVSTSSLLVSTASYSNTSTSASYATNALTASYALVAAAGGFPYTGSAQITGSLGITGSVNSTLGFTGSLQGTASYATNALTASYALVAAAGGFPYTGSAQITGSLGVTGSVNSTLGFTGSLLGTSSYATSASYASFATTASSAPGYTVSFTQSAAAATWSFVHNMNTRYPIVQVYGSDYKQVIPNDIVGVDVNTVEVRFDYAATGYAIMSNGGGLYVTGSTSLLNQTSAATTWSFTHNLNSKYVNFEVYDSNDYVLIPSAIRAIDVNSAELHFAGATAGKAVANFSGINGAPNATTASYALTSTSASYATNATSASYLNPIVSSYVVLTQVSQSLNFVDDAAAAAGGVPLGGLYRNGNFILIRIS